MYQRTSAVTRDIELFYIMNVNLNLYKYFLAVMAEQSVSRAADKLGVSQPTVSYNIHALQKELGERLFTVERSGVVPAPRALVLYRRIKPVYLLFMQQITAFIQEQGK